MDQSGEQHNILVFKLWLDSDTLYEWTDPKKSRMYVQKALDRVDSPHLLKLGVFSRSRNGLQPIPTMSAMGEENIYRRLDALGHD